MSTHLITGVTGQDGVLLARSILAEGGRVVGTCRPGSRAQASMAPYLEGVTIVELDVCDNGGFDALVAEFEPAEIYNLAAMSSVGESWRHPETAISTNGESVVRMLEVLSKYPDTRFLQASSAELSGASAASPYATGKALAQDAVRSARDGGQFASSAVLHIHESPLRRPEFVVRKITRAVAAIALGQADGLTLGNISVRRDWGAALDHVAAMRRIIGADEPADYTVATGEVHSLRDVVEYAFAVAGIDDPWPLVSYDASLIRPRDEPELTGDPTPLMTALGWKPQHRITDVIADMVRVDMERLASGVEESPAYLRVPHVQAAPR